MEGTPKRGVRERATLRPKQIFVTSATLLGLKRSPHCHTSFQPGPRRYKRNVEFTFFLSFQKKTLTLLQRQTSEVALCENSAFYPSFAPILPIALRNPLAALNVMLYNIIQSSLSHLLVTTSLAHNLNSILPPAWNQKRKLSHEVTLTFHQTARKPQKSKLS